MSSEFACFNSSNVDIIPRKCAHRSTLFANKTVDTHIPLFARGITARVTGKRSHACRVLKQGAEVIVPSAMLSERERLQRTATSREDLMSEQKVEHDLVEEKEVEFGDEMSNSSEQAAMQNVSIGYRSKSGGESAPFSVEALAPSMKMLQRGAWSLLRFLVAISMRRATPSTLAANEEFGLRRHPHGDAPNLGEGAHQATRDKDESVASSVRVTATGTIGTTANTNATRSVLMPPTRERSTYGTPFKQMRMHVDSLHQVKLSEVGLWQSRHEAVDYIIYDITSHSAGHSFACVHETTTMLLKE